jgi:hypothetical protein
MRGYSAFWVLRCRGRACTLLARPLMRRARTQALSSIFTLREKMLIAPPSPHRPDGRLMPKTPRRPPIPYTLFRLGSLRLWFCFLFVCPKGNHAPGVREGAERAKRSGVPLLASTEENVVPNHTWGSGLPNRTWGSGLLNRTWGSGLPNHPLISSRTKNASTIATN